MTNWIIKKKFQRHQKSQHHLCKYQPPHSGGNFSKFQNPRRAEVTYSKAYDFSFSCDCRKPKLEQLILATLHGHTQTLHHSHVKALKHTTHVALGEAHTQNDKMAKTLQHKALGVTSEQLPNLLITLRKNNPCRKLQISNKQLIEIVKLWTKYCVCGQVELLETDRSVSNYCRNSYNR